MRPSISQIFPRSLTSIFRQPAAVYQRRARGTWNRKPSRKPSRSTGSPHLFASNPDASSNPYPLPKAATIPSSNIYTMDRPNIQWWAKPALKAAIPQNQANGVFTIPGLGNSTPNGSLPFTQPASTPSNAPVPSARAPAASQPAIPTEPRAKPMSDRDEIVAPSLASGGVPDPTVEYLQRTSVPSTILPVPKPMLVVMDLNGTLLYRPNRKNATSFVERPYAKRFLQYCLDTFHVVIWSSARPTNVQSMFAQLLNGLPGPKNAYRDRVLAVWGRDRFGLSKADFNLRVQVYKRLEMVWNDPRVKGSHPDIATGGRWDQSNTVLIDDSIEKARSEPYNLLRIPEFFGKTDEPGLVVPQVHDYLNSLCYQSDISSYMRTHPFQTREDYKLVPPAEQ